MKKTYYFIILAIIICHVSCANKKEICGRPHLYNNKIKKGKSFRFFFNGYFFITIFLTRRWPWKVMV